MRSKLYVILYSDLVFFEIIESSDISFFYNWNVFMLPVDLSWSGSLTYYLLVVYEKKCLFKFFI